MDASATPDVLARWRALLARGEPDLFEGALLIGELVDPAEDARRRRAGGSRSWPPGCRRTGREGLLAGAARVLFDEEGFRGDEESYDEPSNSSVGRVLARRRGMPITLSIVAMEVGKLAGLRLTGIGLPGHFVVGGPDLPEGMYLDPFGGGALCDAEALSAASARSSARRSRSDRMPCARTRRADDPRARAPEPAPFLRAPQPLGGRAARPSSSPRRSSRRAARCCGSAVCCC